MQLILLPFYFLFVKKLKFQQKLYVCSQHFKISILKEVLCKKMVFTIQQLIIFHLQNLFLISQKRLNNNKGPENILQCEGGSYLDLQYKYKETNQ